MVDGKGKSVSLVGVLRVMIPFGVFLAILVMPPLPGLPPAGQRALAAMVLAILLWILETVPIAVAGLLSVVVLALIGGVPKTADAFYGFSRPTVYFFLGVLTLALAVSRVGLVERAARYLIARSQRGAASLYSQMVFSFALLTFVLPSATTRGSLLIPIYEQIFEMVQAARGSALGKAIMLGQAALNRIASTAVLTGGIVPVTAAALLGGFSWTRWFVLASVPVYVTLVLGGVLVYLMHRPRGEAWPAQTLAPAENKSLSAKEIRVALVMAVASLLWLTDFIHHWDAALPALLAAVFLLSPRLGVLSWSDFERSFAWSNFFVLAASLSLAQALVTSGAAAWFARGLVSAVSILPASPVLLLGLLMVASSLLRVAIPNLAGQLALFLPITVAFAQQVGLNPLVCGLAVTLVADAVVIYSAQGASTLIAYRSGHFSAGDLLKVGLGMNVISYTVILLVALPYWRLVGEPLAP